MREDITLREIIAMVLGRKWLICIITAIAVIISGVYSFFILEPTYNASATLLAKPIESNRINMANGISEMIDSLGVYPNMTIDTYKEQVLSSNVLKNTIYDLKLTNSQGEPMQWSNLAKKISVDVVNNTNLLKISVNDKDPELAANIANSVAENLIKNITDNTKKFGEHANSVIEELLYKEEVKLDEQAKKLQMYLANSQNIEQIKIEVQSLFNKINAYNMSLVDIEKQIETDKKALDNLLDGKSTFSGIDLEKDISINIPINNDITYENMDININSTDKLHDALIIIKATDIETRLIQNIAEKESLEVKINELEARLIQAQTILAEEEYKYNAILRNYSLMEQTYNAYLDRHKEAVLATTSNIGESAIIITAPATIPIEKSNHGKLYYLAIGTMAGLIMGVLFALIVAYWKETDTKINHNINDINI